MTRWDEGAVSDELSDIHRARGQILPDSSAGRHHSSTPVAAAPESAPYLTK
jgi:hypothetical protein